MIFAIAALAHASAPPVAVVADPAPDPITSITLTSTSVDWSSYAPPTDFAGYDIRYTTVLGQAWASATDLAPGLQIQSSIALSAFPAGAVECLVVPVDAAGHIGFPEARQALVVVTPPAAITQIALQSDRVAWTYTPPSDFSGYDVRYSTTLGQAWASAPKLYPALRTAAQNFALLSDFPGAAVECLVAPVNTGGATGLPEARQGGLQAPANPYALGPAAAFAANWTPQPGDATVLITQEAGGIVVDCTRNGTPPDAATTPFLTLWAKTALPAGRDWTLKSRWTQLDTNLATQSDGIFVQIVTATGGANGSDANPNLWTTAQYQDAALTYRSTTGGYDKYSTGWRFSFDQDATVTANSDELRGHSFSGGTETQLGVAGTSYAVPLPVAPNVAYDLTQQWRSATNTLTWTLARADGTGTPVVVPVSDAGIATTMGAYLGLNVSPGRKVRVENVALTDDGAGGGGPHPPPPGETWRDDTTQWAQILPLSQVSAGSIVHINSNADLPRMNPGTPGTTYVIGAALTGSVTVTGAGTKAAPIVIRGDYDGTDVTQFRKWTGNQSLTISGASHVYVAKLCFVGTSNTSSNGQVAIANGATRISIERCWSYGQNNSGNLYESTAYRCDGSAIRWFRLRYCEHGNAGVNTQAGIWTLGNPNGATTFPQFIYCYRNLIHHRNDSGIPASAFGGVVFSIGRGETSSDVDNKAAFYENRARDITGPFGEGMEMKNSGTVLAYNTIEAASNGNAFPLRFRHGHNGSMIGNLFVDSAGGTNAGLIQVRGSSHTIINNWCVQLAAGAQVAAGSPLGGSALVLWGGNIDGSVSLALVKSEQSTPRPNSIACLAGGNRMAITVGNPDPAGGTPLGSVVCVVGPNASGSSVPYRNRSWSIGSDGDKDYYGRGKSRAQYGANTNPSYGTTFGGSSTITNQAIAGADYDKVPTRLFDADVGVACTVYP